MPVAIMSHLTTHDIGYSDTDSVVDLCVESCNGLIIIPLSTRLLLQSRNDRE